MYISDSTLTPESFIAADQHRLYDTGAGQGHLQAPDLASSSIALGGRGVPWGQVHNHSHRSQAPVPLSIDKEASSSGSCK